MNNFAYSRGSTWRKWDLHIHSEHSQENSAKMKIKEIFQKAIDNDVAMISITDHSNFDGLDEIWNVWENHNYNDKPIKEQINFLPGIELRTNSGKKSVHVIVIFPKELLVEKEICKSNKQTLQENFLSKIDYTNAKIKSTAKGDYKTGLFNITVSFETLIPIVKELGGILIIHAGSKNNGIEKEITHAKGDTEYELLNSLGTNKEKIMNEIDICELPNWFEKNIKEQNFYLSKFNNPSLVCSDSHKNYERNLYSWIKADPSFEGLKQIIYEPEERVKLQETVPDEKINYQLIKSIKFLDDKFIESNIKINPNLISIIGDKSTGKSIFLRSIARSIDSNQVVEKYDDIKKPSQKDPVVEVEWNDGKIDNDVSDTKRKIMYIPQTFLNEKIDRDEPNSFINQILHEVLVQKEEFRNILDKIKDVESLINKKINDKINNVFDLQDKRIEIENRINELGKKEDVVNEVKKLDESCKILQLKGEASKEEIEIYDTKTKEYTDKLRIHDGNFEALKNLGLILNSIELISSDELVSFQIPYFGNIDYELKGQINKKFIKLKDSVKFAISLIFKINFIKIKEEIESLKKDLSDIDKIIEPLKSKINFSDVIKQKSILLKNEEEKLSSLEKELENLSRINLDYEKKIDDLINLNISYEEKLNEVKKELPTNVFTEVNFTIDILFNQQKFNSDVRDFLNLTKFTAFRDSSKIDLNNFKYTDPKIFKESLKKIIIAILNQELPTKSKKSPKDAVLNLLQNWYFFKYNVEDEGDTLESMSPGKRSFVLLKILIDLDNSKWPILIDQPEDDLDSKSISKELVHYLKIKKKERQIIIVSHNPNLVLGADCEQIIVANQTGSNSQNKNKRFEYVSGSIENTFRNPSENCLLYCRGIKEHVCEILEGGVEAFKKRQDKYNIQ